VAEQKTIKRKVPSQVYQTGPSKPPSIALARLLVKASMKSGITLPKSVLVDLEKSGLPDKYAELGHSEKKQ
jgi:hypothetical protein